MKLNREQIISVAKCRRAQGICTFEKCPYGLKSYECTQITLNDAFAVIYELTEENNSLKSAISALKEEIRIITEKNERLKVNNDRRRNNKGF